MICFVLQSIFTRFNRSLLSPQFKNKIHSLYKLYFAKSAHWDTILNVSRKARQYMQVRDYSISPFFIQYIEYNVDWSLCICNRLLPCPMFSFSISLRAHKAQCVVFAWGLICTVHNLRNVCLDAFYYLHSGMNETSVMFTKVTIYSDFILETLFFSLVNQEHTVT